MPLYEYRCDADGTTLEILRPIAQADAPVTDPDGKGRSFRRIRSTFTAAGTAAGSAASVSTHRHTGSYCPCGKNKAGGSCGS
jgi:putative FmdB family regulatory protein